MALKKSSKSTLQSFVSFEVGLTKRSMKLAPFKYVGGKVIYLLSAGASQSSTEWSLVYLYEKKLAPIKAVS